MYKGRGEVALDGAETDDDVRPRLGDLRGFSAPLIRQRVYRDIRKLILDAVRDGVLCTAVAFEAPREDAKRAAALTTARNKGPPRVPSS